MARAPAEPARQAASTSRRDFGEEAALTAGIDAAAADAVIAMDADLQAPPALIPRLDRGMARGAEVVLARRSDRSSDSFLKRDSRVGLFYRIHNRFESVQYRKRRRFPADRPGAVEALKALPERQRFMKGLFAWIGFRPRWWTTRAPARVGSTKFSGWRLWNFALEGITSFSTAAAAGLDLHRRGRRAADPRLCDVHRPGEPDFRRRRPGIRLARGAVAASSAGST